MWPSSVAVELASSSSSDHENARPPDITPKFNGQWSKFFSKPEGAAGIVEVANKEEMITIDIEAMTSGNVVVSLTNWSQGLYPCSQFILVRREPFLILMVMTNTSRILYWNCRGAKNAQFLLSIKELLKIHKPLEVAIPEPRIYGATADGVCNHLGKRNWFRVEATRYNNGIWQFWNREEVDVQIHQALKQFVDLSLHTLPDSGP